ncbi:MAG TPA: penicillin-insensitive murein endopeptidase [Actinomycetota bacterium]
MRHPLVAVLAALLLFPGAPPQAQEAPPQAQGASPPAQGVSPPAQAVSHLAQGVPHRDLPGSGAPTGRVAQPGKRVLAAVHRGAGGSADEGGGSADEGGVSARGAGGDAGVSSVGVFPMGVFPLGVSERGRPPEAGIVWRRSRAVGKPNHGRLLGGVELPAAGTLFVTVDPVTGTSPNRAWRRYGTDRLLRVLLRVAEEHAAAHPGAARLVIGDLSRPHGGRFGPEYGGDGHRSHQTGLDADVYYPRRDGLERIPRRVGQVDRHLAQELVDRFVRAGAQYVFVGPRTGLGGPAKVVMTLANHDDHLHVRIRPGGAHR